MTRLILAAGATIALATAGLSYVAKQNEIAFTHLSEAKDRLVDTGFYCISDRSDGSLGCGFLISREAMSWSEAGLLRKIGPMGPEWKGKVWVTLHQEHWRVVSLPDHAGVRVWGSVVAYGDEEVLSELEEFLAPAPFSFL